LLGSSGGSLIQIEFIYTEYTTSNNDFPLMTLMMKQTV